MRPAPIRPESHVRRAERVLAQKGADKLILLDPDGGEYFTLDAVGSRVWELADGSRTVAAIAKALEQEFDAPADVIEADVLELLDELAAARLVDEAG